ncbi:MAG: haloalkane dehalogenase [Proteobacteria bacterium]|nr:haloalkane dehalogenase [Pseudomonadota bacterium]
MISAEERHQKRKIEILGHTMSYVDEGSGDPIVLLHGNPTSSYLWRNVIPHLTSSGRCIAPDLIGMGDSEKLQESGPDSYSFLEHRKYLDAFLEAVGASKNVTLVVHDWGSGLGFDWACRHPNAVKGIAYMEAILYHYTWDSWPENARKIFQGFRSPAGEEMILEKNIFVELVLPSSVLRGLTDEEMAVYRRPFLNPGEDRRPTLTWPRQLPIDNDPKEVVEIVETYGQWLSKSKVPKLFINADPGAILTGKARDFCRTWPNQQEVTVKGNHFIQEDSPDEIGQAVAAFISGLN